MSTMISQALNIDGTWTVIASGPVANVLIAGPASGWELYIGSSLPAPATTGLPVTAIDGAWSSSALAAGDNIYARPFGRLASGTVNIRGIKN